MMLCALCLRDPSTGPLVPVREHPELTEAVTIANGNALCLTHFERVSDVQSEVHGPPSIAMLVARMHAPSASPEQPWLTRDA